MRLDLLLVQRQLVQSRSHAQELIKAGQVVQIIDSKQTVLSKPSLMMADDAHVEIVSGPANRFVSRGGLKLEGALEHLGLDVQGLRILDIGTSTGGFSDCLLQRGAAFVLGVDVGQGQLHPSLKAWENFHLVEETNARDLSRDAEFLDRWDKVPFDLVVMDVSFISISLIIPELVFFLKKSGLLLSLVKPQFEVGISGLGKGGIVKDRALYAGVEEKVRKVTNESGLEVRNYFESSIVGKEGNHEFFIFAEKKF